MRIAVLDEEKCKPKDCMKNCYRFCPMVRSRVEAIVFAEEKPTIIESLCNGCGLCVKKCPFKALKIINLPEKFKVDIVHRYGVNDFGLFRLPIPKEGSVTGLIGRNGIGKTTALRILAGELVPNLGKVNNEGSWDDVIEYYRGSVLQEYFRKLKSGKLKVVHKPQHVDLIPKIASGSVREILHRQEPEQNKLNLVIEKLQLGKCLEKDVSILSGGELQRLAIAVALLREADVYIFDEPSSYLDIRQRLEMAKAIQLLKKDGKIIVLSEHDLAVLDYLSDQVCILYGEPGAYGVVSHPHGVRTGINLYIKGYIPDENVRFRKHPIKFPVHLPYDVWRSKNCILKWGEFVKTYNSRFKLEVDSGYVTEGEVIGILGPNGIGKTTFIKVIAGVEKAEGLQISREVKISYKPQYLSAKYEGIVEDLLKLAAGEEFNTSFVKHEIIEALSLDGLLDRSVKSLSGGELQRLAIAVCLLREADLYLLDEPSAFLDVEERLAMAKTIRRVVESRKAAAFVVEHDIVAEDFIADRIMVFTGEPGVHGKASKPMTLRDGMNCFLKKLGITFRRDPETLRPRVNKEGSKIDKLQKERGEYYYVSAD